jgi:pilus assembly protein FimV
MPRFLAATCLMLSGFLPLSAWALGLGEIDLKTALNQPLVAEIALSSESTEDLSAVTAELAAAKTFQQYGLDRPAFFSDFNFAVVARGDRSVIRITSTQPVAEPFVTMLVEVRWPQGRLLREYTVLLDPPVFVSAPPQPVLTPQAPATAAESAPAPIAQPEIRNDSTRRPTAVSRPAPAPPRVTAPTVSNQGQIQGQTYGPVQRSETLWSIARRARPENSSLDVNQAMLAIYRANPEAFAGNINRLKRGAILRLPERDEFDRLGRGEAFAEVSRQNDQWQAQRSPPAEKTGRLRLVPPPEESESPAESDARGAAPATEPAPGTAASTDPATGTSDSLQTKVADLETQLDDRNRLLELRNQELQALQERLAQLDDRAAVAPEVDAVAAEGDAAQDETAEDGAAEITGLPSAEEIEAALTPEFAEPEVPVEEAPGATPPADVSTGVPSATTPEEQPSFIWALFSNWWLYVGIALVFVAALFVVRRRSGDEPTGRWEALAPDDAAGLDEDSIEATERLRARRPAEETFVVEERPAEDTDVFSTANAEADAEIEIEPPLPITDEDTELPLERTISADTAVNLDEADPVAEAEFHMAYGLYDQAADILVNAQSEEPARKDLSIKLLEVFFVWENKSAFLKEAQAFHERMGPETDQNWNKVLIMGKQICPDEALFSEAPSSGDDIDLSIGEAGNTGIDLVLDEESVAGALDFDFDSDDAGDGGLDLDIGDDLVSDDASRDQSTVVDLGPSETPTIETPTIETPGPASPTVETPTIESPQVDEPDLTSETAEIELDDLGLDLEGLEELEDIVDDISEQPEQAGDDELLSSDFADETMLESPGETSKLGMLNEDLVDDADTAGVLDVESTAEMLNLQDSDETGGGLGGLVAAMEKSTPTDIGSDTAEQPRPETQGSPDDIFSEEVLAGASDSEADIDLDVDLDLDLGDEDSVAGENEPTGTIDIMRGPEGPTMTEVGTKLDLARAYVDMGDPDGARSILNEVLEEGGESQRQEAQKLMDDLGN